MKCVSCEIEVSSNFVSSIEENKCPACGKELLPSSEYNKLFSLRKQLIGLDLGLEKRDLTKISAAITSKFDLWPKGMMGEGPELTEETMEDIDLDIPLTPPPGKKGNTKPIKTVGNRSYPIDDPSMIGHIDIEDGPPMSPEQEAALIKEFGLDKGEFGMAQALKDEGVSGSIDPELAKSIMDYDFGTSDEGDERLQRAEKMLANAGSKKIRRL